MNKTSDTRSVPALLVAAVAFNASLLATLALPLTPFTAYLLVALVFAAPAVLALASFETRGYARAFCIGAFLPSFGAMLLTIVRCAQYVTFFTFDATVNAIYRTIDGLRVAVEMCWLLALVTALLWV